MSDDEPQVVPGLNDDTPVERPVMSRSRAKRLAAQRGEPDPVLSAFQAPPPPPPQPALPPVPPKPRTYLLYRVAEEFEFSRGASMATFGVGDVLSAQHYDIAGLVKQGCKLEQLP